MIVVDTNILAHYLIVGAHTPLARDLLAADPEWAAPILWRSEFRNLLATYVRARDLPVRDALTLMRSAEILIGAREHLGKSRDILELAATSRQSAYDCEFVSVARTLGVPLLTNDNKLCRSFPEIAVSPAEFLARR